MGHTNSTANYNLPQFVGSDKPTWLGDVNGAMSAIDAAIATAASAATDAASVATNAATVAAGAVTTANAASETATAASTAASTATATANTAADTANNAQSTAVLAKGTADNAATAAATADGKADAANSAIGDLADLDTTDKSSVVAAINEVVAELPSGGGSVSVTADGVKDHATLLSELAALVDFSKLTAKSVLRVGVNHFPIFAWAGTNTILFAGTKTATAEFDTETYEVYNGVPNIYLSQTTSSGTTFSKRNTTVPTSGTIFEITY